MSFSSSVLGSAGKRGILYPCSFNSLIASFNWGIEALILGSFIMLASGVLASSPSSVRASPIFWSSLRLSGKLAKILPAREISLSSSSILATEVKALTMGSRDSVARAGASSVFV